MNKRYIFVVIGIILSLLLALILYFTLFNNRQIEDTNGDLTSLTTINRDDMVNTINKYVSYQSSQTYEGNITGINDRLKAVDYDHIYYSSKKLSGIVTIQATYLEENQNMNIIVDSVLRSGNMEIIVVSPDDEIVSTIHVNSKDVIEINHSVEGIYRLVIGCESAQFTISVNRNLE